MKTSTKAPGLSRQEMVALVLRKCALICDPKNGFLKSLADEMETHNVTISVWIRQGYVPQHQVLKLQKRFGEEVASMEDLCPAQYRRS